MTPLSSAFSCQPSAVSFKTNRRVGFAVFLSKSSKFKVQSSRLVIWPSGTFHHLRVSHRPMSDCLEKVFRRVRPTHQLVSRIGLKSSKFKVQSSRLVIWASGTFHHLRVSQRPMSDCLEKVFRRVRPTHQLVSRIGGQCPPTYIFMFY